MASPQIKRLRSLSPSGGGIPSPKRFHSISSAPDPSEDSEAYFVDPAFAEIQADIYLKVENTLFPFTLERLQDAGGFFSTLFSIPQPEDAELIHGLPFCNMYQYSVRELRALLLQIYYDGVKSVFMKTLGKGRTEFDLEAILDVIAISSRLDLPKCRQKAADALQLLFELMWKYRLYPPTSQLPEVSINERPFGKESIMCMLSFRMINVFEQCDLPYFLPFAYYFACQQPVDVILDGISLQDGTRETISLDHQKVVLKGREDLRYLRRNVTFYWLKKLASQNVYFPQRSRCTGGDNCHSFLTEMTDSFFTVGSPVLENRCDALNGLSFSALQIMKNHVCTHCYMDFRDEMLHHLGLSWDRLPLIFTGRDWRNLKMHQNELDQKWLAET